MNSAVVRDATELDNVDVANTNYLLGLMAEHHVEWDDARVEGLDPTLTQMTTKALQVVFFICVVGMSGNVCLLTASN